MLTSFYFGVSIEGIGLNMPFSEVSGLTKKMDTEEVTCGGENRFKYRLPASVASQNLILKRGIVDSKSKLLQWVDNTLNNGLSLPIKPKNITVNLFDAEGKVSMSWHFIGAYPISWSATDLHSQENKLIIETVELAYRYFEVQ